MTKIEWTEPAVADLTALHDYIARDSERYARQFIGRILEAVEQLEELPESGRKVPEALEENIRELLFRSYRIIYRVEPRRVRILTVLHGSRDLRQADPKPWEIA